jgi:TruD family tRNA pseudouridine synthase
MQERFDSKQQEFNFLKEEYKRKPELFDQKSFTEGPETLGEFGIYIPHKDDFPAGYIKLWPEDFIVEEVGTDGHQYTIAPGEGEPAAGEGTVVATLVKCGLSTLEAVADIAAQLGVPVDSISYAGIKDKDAITAQRIAIKSTSTQAVAAITSPFYFLKDIQVGKGVVQKGELTGNRFTILIRTPESLENASLANALAASLKSVHAHGFYNFFYLQRFGTPRLCNFLWALDILKGDYKAAVKSVFAYTGERELPYFIALRQKLGEHFGKWESMAELLKPFPYMMQHEHKLVRHLSAHPDDFAGALKMIPEQTTLWMYALSSIYFNQKISDYLIDHKEPPEELPFFLSPHAGDWEPYKQMLTSHKVYPVPLKNLRPFPQVQIRRRRAKTKDRAKILAGEIVPEGFVLQFVLGKGQYATTFLSHLFNLVSGYPPQGLSFERVNTKQTLGDSTTTDTIARFEKVIHSKGENAFELLMGRE